MLRLPIIILTLLMLVVADGARAHEIRPAIATVNFGADRYDIEISANLEAVIAGVSPQHKDTDESPNAQTYNRLRELPPVALEGKIREFLPQYLGGIEIRFDDTRLPPALCSVTVPEAGEAARARLTLLHLCGAIPAGARAFQWAYAADFGESILRLPAASGGE